LNTKNSCFKIIVFEVGKMNNNSERMTHELASLFDSFYSKFILRDLFGKIIPGLIIFFPITWIVFSPSDFQFAYGELFTNIWIWILLIGIFWITGFAIQGFGDMVSVKLKKRGKKFFLLRYYPLNVTRDEFYKVHIDFNKKANSSESKVVERLIVIKESCGNGHIALSFSLIILLIYSFSIIIVDLLNTVNKINSVFSVFIRENFLLFIGLTILIIILIKSLKYMHKEHIDRQWHYMKKVIELYEEPWCYY